MVVLNHSMPKRGLAGAVAVASAVLVSTIQLPPTATLSWPLLLLYQRVPSVGLAGGVGLTIAPPWLATTVTAGCQVVPSQTLSVALAVSNHRAPVVGLGGAVALTVAPPAVLTSTQAEPL